MQDPFSWDDLHLVLTVRREGSLAGAARALGLNHATVFRRLNAVEAVLGVRLFDRARSGYAATDAGQLAADLAARIERDILDLRRRLDGQDQRPAGAVRLTTTDALMVLVGLCQADLRAANPDITLELVVSSALSDLGRREADLALRALAAGTRPPADLFGRRAGALAYAVFGLRGSFAPDTPLHAMPWVAPGDNARHAPSAAWMAAHVPEATIAGRGNGLLAIIELVRAGAGVALLPCFLGDREPALTRLGDGALPMILDLWVLTHEDLSGVVRIRATLTALVAAIGARGDLLAGHLPAFGPA